MVVVLAVVTVVGGVVSLDLVFVLLALRPPSNKDFANFMYYSPLASVRLLYYSSYYTTILLYYSSILLQ